MIDLSKYRIVDLSHEMVPGEKKSTGATCTVAVWRTAY